MSSVSGTFSVLAAHDLMDYVAETHGGALVSKIHKHTSHGDPLIRRFTDQILEEVSFTFLLIVEFHVEFH